MHNLVSAVHLYLIMAPMLPLTQPALVYREEWITLVWVHPEALRAELAFWFPENLTGEEHRQLRAAYGCTVPLNQPPPDRFLEGRMCDGPPVPECLRIPPTVQAAMSA